VTHGQMQLPCTGKSDGPFRRNQNLCHCRYTSRQYRVIFCNNRDKRSSRIVRVYCSC